MASYLDATAGVPLHPVARTALLAALDDGWADISAWCRMRAHAYAGAGAAADGTPAYTVRHLH